MERKLTVLLIEDDPEECTAFAECMKPLGDISLIATTNSSSEGIRYVRDLSPDAVILDLELHQGSGNGLLFLQELRELRSGNPPYILVTTNNISKHTYNQARTFGADFIMAKHQQDYSPEKATEFLLLMKKTIQNPKQGMQDFIQPSGTNENARLMQDPAIQRLNAELNHVGISPKAVGRKYLFDAIQIILQEERPNICSDLARKYKKSDASVERAMQNAINRAWRTADIDDLCYHYTARIHSEKGVPTIMEFIHYYSQKLKE